MRTTRREASKASLRWLSISLWLALCFATSCTPAELYIAADAATYDALAPEHAAYVRADAGLDAAQKQRRFDTLATWKKRVQDAGGTVTAAVPEVDQVVVSR